MTKPKLIVTLCGYVILIYIFILLPQNLYTPTRYFNLPGILWFVHLILLYIHEAGHLFFSVFGKTIGILGGSLNQILAPLVWFIVAKREASSLSSVALFFTGVSVVDVSIYVKDAELLLLPLIGGLSKAHHDWRNLLGGWGIIEWSFTIGEIMFWSGMLLAGVGLYGGIKNAITEYRAGRCLSGKKIITLPNFLFRVHQHHNSVCHGVSLRSILRIG